MKRVLIKLSGEYMGLTGSEKHIGQVRERLDTFAQQLKKITIDHQVSIVIGGGNVFRGSVQGAQLGLIRSTADQVGMLATVMNGLVLADVLTQQELEVVVFGAFTVSGIVDIMTPGALARALDERKIIIFVGGTGCPLFSTDTCAIIRAVQCGASEIWKATKVDGVYSQDPVKYPQATFIKHLSYQQAIDLNIQVTDRCALYLACEHNLALRIFTIFTTTALLDAAYQDAGSTIRNNKGS